MTKIYGCSDDLIEIENCGVQDEIDCFDKDLRMWFQDGTVIRIGYPKQGKAIWWIEVEKKGTANQRLSICDDEDAEIYSDVFEIESRIQSCSVLEKKYGWK